MRTADPGGTNFVVTAPNPRNRWNRQPPPNNKTNGSKGAAGKGRNCQPGDFGVIVAESNI
jgi:hypothetical protein